MEPVAACGTMAQERWSSRMGVILAVAGSAVGLGNFLRFPGQAAEYGGGAFMIAYFVSLLVLGLPICWAEWTMGRYGGLRGLHSAPGVLMACMGRPAGKYLGAIGIVIPVVIYMYYVVIESWCLGYAVNFLAGNMHFTTPAEAGAFFEKMIGVGADGSAVGFGLTYAGTFLAIVFVLNFILIYRGVSKGIEWFCNIAMPALVIIAVIVLFRVLTLGTPDPAQPERNVLNGLGFMWNPEKVLLEKNGPEGWQPEERLIGNAALASAQAKAAADPAYRVRSVGMLDQLSNPQLWLAAAGQIFFSLSVGFGVILTYASYLRKNDDVVLSGASATSANEFCEVALGGLITIPAGVAFLGVSGVAGMASTFGLGFNVLPLVFSEMPAGRWFGCLFFFLLFLAAITSSISMLQPGIAFLEETLEIGRKQSVALLGFITAVGCAFVFYFSAGLKALDTLDFWVGTFLIFLLATIQIIVFGWVMGVRKGLAEASVGATFRIPAWIGFVMKYISPAFLLLVFSMWVTVNVLGIRLGGGPSQVSSYVKDLFLQPNLVAWMSIALAAAFTVFVLLLSARARAYRHLAPEDQP